MNKTLQIILALALGYGLAYAGTTLRSQDMPPTIEIGGLLIQGSKTNAEIQALVCTNGKGRCIVASTDEGDGYMSFGNSAGEYRNIRTGKLP